MNERQCYRLGFQIIRSQGRTGPTPTYNFQQFKVQSGQTHLVHLAIILPTVTSNCLIQTRHHNIQRAKNVHQFFFCHFLIPLGQKKKIFQLQPLFRQTWGLILLFELLEVLNARGDSLRALSSRCKTKKQQCLSHQQPPTVVASPTHTKGKQ